MKMKPITFSSYLHAERLSTRMEKYYRTYRCSVILENTHNTRMMWRNSFKMLSFHQIITNSFFLNTSPVLIMWKQTFYPLVCPSVTTAGASPTSLCMHANFGHKRGIRQPDYCLFPQRRHYQQHKTKVSVLIFRVVIHHTGDTMQRDMLHHGPVLFVFT